MILTKAKMASPAVAKPANDNMPGTITPDDTRCFVALGIICAGVLILAAYLVIGGSDDLMTVALRRSDSGLSRRAALHLGANGHRYLTRGTARLERSI